MGVRAKTMVVDRRTTLRWIAAAVASGHLAACGESAEGFAWFEPQPLTGKGYGGDPNMLEPSVPWGLTLTTKELVATKALVDLILPAEGNWPSASDAGTPAFIDEWVSAPYPDQQKDRALILPGLAWIDAEATKRSGKEFVLAGAEVQKAIADEIAFKDRVAPGLEKQGAFFARMRALTLGAYFTSPKGWEEIGYPGNKPGTGAYAGPTPEAIDHMRGLVEGMGLTFTPP
jgi:hypothetical protein